MVTVVVEVMLKIEMVTAEINSMVERQLNGMKNTATLGTYHHLHECFRRIDNCHRTPFRLGDVVYLHATDSRFKTSEYVPM